MLVSFFLDIGCYFLFLLKFLGLSLLNDEDSVFVGGDDFLIDLFLELSFLLILQLLFSLELFHFLNHDLSLSFLLFLLSQPVDLSGFDLLNDDFLAPQSFLFLSLFDLLNFFYFFESFDFHELVLLFLLHFVGFPISFLLVQLLFPNGCSFGIGNHLVHQLHIVEILIGRLLSSVLDAIFELHFLSFKLVGR